MTERKPYRPRKVVDYSKFISQDSDDDDFSVHSYTRPTKKSKLSSSDNKTQNDTRSSKRIGQELVVKNKHSNQNKVEATNHCAGKENANQPISSTLRTSDKKISTVVKAAPNKSNTSLQEFTTIVPVHADDSKTFTNRSVEVNIKESNEKFQEFYEKAENSETNMKDDQSRIVLKNNETHTSIQGKLCTNKDITDSTEVKCTTNANMPQPPTAVRPAVMPKWKAPGPASQNSVRSESEGCSRICMGLRLGLSRNTRVKPLHANVKFQL